jgi:hypothetical protein
MWYPIWHEKADFRASPGGRRAANPDSGPAVVLCFCLVPWPDSALQHTRRVCATGHPAAGLRRPDSVECPPCVQRTWAGCSPERLLATLDNPSCFHVPASRVTARPAPSQPPRVWKINRPVLTGRGQLPVRSHPAPGHGRNDSPNLHAAGHPVEMGQALDHQSRRGRYAQKNQSDRLAALVQRYPDWALGYGDEVWWGRVLQPTTHTWQKPDQPVRLVEQVIVANDPDPKALARYGLLVRHGAVPWLRFVEGYPISTITGQFLEWYTQLAARSVLVWLLAWDNASCHVSKTVRIWIRSRNQQVKWEQRGLRTLSCYLPVKSPWFNPIEPKWMRNKQTIVEPTATQCPGSG